MGSEMCIRDSYKTTRVPHEGSTDGRKHVSFPCEGFRRIKFQNYTKIHKAWETPLRKDQELRGIRNGAIGGYHEWLKVHIQV